MNIDKIVFADGSTVRPTEAGEAAIVQRIRQGYSLEEAVKHIAGCPGVFRRPPNTGDIIADLRETTARDQQREYPS